MEFFFNKFPHRKFERVKIQNATNLSGMASTNQGAIAIKWEPGGT